MCRLMGYVASTDTTFSDLAGSSFSEFQSLASKHRDGWGVAVTPSQGEAKVILDPGTALDNEKFAEVTSSLNSDAALLHLRWATLGLKVDETNTHPFTHGEYSFIHNGSINPPKSLEALVAEDLKANFIGDTDSERYFYALLTSIRQHGLEGGIISAVREIRSTLDYSSVNAMLLTPHKFVVITEFNSAKIPSDEGPEYYDLYYRRDERGVLVASSGWNQDGWVHLPNHRVLVVDRSTQEIEIYEI